MLTDNSSAKPLPFCSFTFFLSTTYLAPFLPQHPALLTGGLPRAGRLLSWMPTSSGPCGVTNTRSSPVLVGAAAGWDPSLVGLVMITIWWSSPRSILPELSNVSKSANRSSDVCPVIRVSDIAMCRCVPLHWTLWVLRGHKLRCCSWTINNYLHILTCIWWTRLTMLKPSEGFLAGIHSQRQHFFKNIRLSLQFIHKIPRTFWLYIW